MRTSTLFLLALILPFQIYSAIQVQETNWIGQIGNWNDTLNWDCNCIPAQNDVVKIDSGQVTISSGQKVFAFSVIIESPAKLINWDTLQIENDSLNGIIINGEMTNYGVIQMIDAKSTGIYNRGKMTNYGFVKINPIGDSLQLGETSLAVSASNPDTAFLDNYGTIEIQAYPNKHCIWTILNYQLINHPGGQINLYGGNNVGTGIYVGSYDPNKLINYGDIFLEGGEISGGGKLVNYGNILQHHLEDDPSAGFFASGLFNKPGGLYSLKNIQTGAFVFNDSIVNEGTILIDSTGGDAIIMSNGSYWSNTGYFEVLRAGRFGVYICNGCAFQNFEGGTFKVKKSDENAFHQFGNNSSFYNSGHLIVDSIGLTSGASNGEHGIAIGSGGTFKNDSSGIITIRYTDGTGIVRNSGLLSENFGLIDISNNGKDGFQSSGTEPFYNRSSGKMYFSEAAESGLNVAKPGFFGVGYFTNQGYIEADSLMGGYGIENTQTLVNDPSGVIVTYSRMRNTAIFTNHGILKCKNKIGHTFSGANGKNEGLIEDYHGLFANTSFLNNRIILSPKLSNGCSLDSILDFIDIGSQSGFHVKSVYRDRDTWQSAGTFDTLTNTLNLGSDVAGYTPLSLEIKNLSTGSTDTLFIQVQTACPVQCPGEPAFWTGCGGISDHWSEPMNWSTGFVPSSGDPVLINGSPASGIFPFVDSTFTIGELLMLQGATMTLMPGQMLIIAND